MTDDPWRFSALKWMARSPAHARYFKGVAFDQTLPMRLGSGAHAMLFQKPWVVYGGKHEEGKSKGKKKVRSGKAWDEFKAAHDDHVILSPTERDKSKAMADAVMGHREACSLLFASDAVHEHRIHWTELGVARSCTPDCRTPRYVAELKSTKCSEPDRFNKDGRFRGYHTQLVDQMDGVVQAGLGAPTEAFIVAVESTPPHVVTVMRLTDRAIDLGRRQRRVWTERLVGCLRDDYWPGYVESVVDFDVEEEFELTFADGSEPDEPEQTNQGRELLASPDEMDAVF